MSTLIPHERPRLLLIDDDPAITTAISLALTQYDLDVQAAFFGEQGIWLAVTEAPNLIITDLQMPYGDGEYVIECLKCRSNTQNIPVVVLTGRRDPKTHFRVMALGAEAYLHKPFDRGRLVEVLRQFIELRDVCNDRNPHALSCGSQTAANS